MSRQSNTSTRLSRRGFSLIELVIVVVIIGIIAAIAIPRMSRGSAGAADAAVQQNLSLLRNAIDMYQQEHNGTLPTLANFQNQMLQYSGLDGSTSASKNSTQYLGPYLRSIPPITVGDNKGKNGVAATADADTAWIYDAATGNVTPYTGTVTSDASGRLYSSY
jgi:prepilin-type N-terminal cleavage/methylation domain-containing protein